MSRFPASTRPLPGAPPSVLRWGSRLFPLFVAASLVTALLVVTLGGVVRVTGSGLGCPDWPQCHGRLVPPADVKAWIEYTHRLSASLATIFTILMALSAIARHGFRPALLLPLAAPILLVVQAALGAFTVRLELDPTVALSHTGVAMAYVGSLALVASGTNPWASAVVSRARAGLARAVSARRITEWESQHVRHVLLALAVLTFVAVLTGAYVYRSGAPLACLGYPFCDTPVATDSAPRLQSIHMLHRYVALATGLLMAYAVWTTWRLRSAGRHLLVLATVAATLMALQVALGASNVLFRLPEWARLAHLVTASLVFTVLMLTVGTVWRRSDA